jgi:hypothetical protein
MYSLLLVGAHASLAPILDGGKLYFSNKSEQEIVYFVKSNYNVFHKQEKDIDLTLKHSSNNNINNNIVTINNNKHIQHIDQLNFTKFTSSSVIHSSTEKSNQK